LKFPQQPGKNKKTGYEMASVQKHERSKYKRASTVSTVDSEIDWEDSQHEGVKEDSFIDFFRKSNGPPQTVLLCLLLALSLGSTIGVLPAVVTDRYARIRHGYNGDEDCSFYDVDDRPMECINGSNDAQNASAVASFVSNMLTFTTSSLMGSISDERGRKGILLLGQFLSLLGPLCLVLLQLFDTMSPNWYYACSACTGFVNWIAIALSTLSDIVPPKWRAASFGLLLAGFSCGFAFSPILALTLSHLGVSILSFSMLGGGFFFTLFCLPETLTPEIAQRAARDRNSIIVHNEPTCGKVKRRMMRPLRELSILNRNQLFRLLATLSFFSGIVSSADQSLLIYYLEDRLRFNDKDISLLFVILGSLGILVQGVFLRPLNELMGEKSLLIFAFSCQTIVNLVYGFATVKAAVFMAVGLGSFGGLAFPTISAMKSYNVEEHEQGRIQGALYSVSSLASAVGPVSLRFIYYQTKGSTFPGPGSMFVFAAFLELIASLIACALPKDQTDSRKKLHDNPTLSTDEPSAMSYGSFSDSSDENDV